MLNRKKTREINVLGTRNVIAACIAAGVARLVYTSTYNVVFGGVPISNGSELLPYYPAEKHVDKYSASKTVAEQLGEERHFPRIVRSMNRLQSRGLARAAGATL
ncbi:hypothetical protein CYMTET_9815 [Cymbomonas tetramitiformis]|uniref:3-beta hydroxysteroid dehydrogenase/isomerase domain-containing protein n=1 Tax=Cymbomonas tetramitiformis TaxID=36881 RepID=A0AAE0GQS7_9CHLO|nr:hypothetical protein CYMTET_9815 [Cymbomonas tetramitiformis]